MTVINRSKGKIRFAFKEAKFKLIQEPRKQSLIMLHFSYGTKLRFKYSTQLYSCYEDWDFNKQRLRNRVHIQDRNQVNDFLNTLETELGKEVSKELSYGNILSVDNLKAKLDGLTNNNGIAYATNTNSFYDYLNTFCNRKRNKIKDVTLRSYRQTERLLKRFDTEIDFKDIDIEFYYSFIEFLEDDDKSLNTIGKHIKNLKVFMNSATNDGINTNFRYKQSDFKAPKEQTPAVYLDEEELKKLAECQLQSMPDLDKARDIFLIGCYTGQRVSDYNGISEDQIIEREKEGRKIRFFKIKQKKTNHEVFCPITKEIQAVLEKEIYKGNMIPKMAEQKINDKIKRVARIAGIKNMINVEYTKGGNLVKQQIPKYKLIGTHTARRSFCTNMYHKGMKTFEIMHFSGHKTEKEFYKYIRVEKEERAMNIALSGYFNL